MVTLVETIANFALGTTFELLPRDVIEESKRIILDSVGCGIAGAATEKGKIAVKFAQQLGGPGDSTIIVCGDKVSTLNAAFANGELVNSMDHEAILSPGHVQPGFVVPASLAMAESRKSSGKDLILAVALGFEISARVASPLAGYRDVVAGQVQGPPVYGFGNSVLGGVAGLSKVMGFDMGILSNALGIAGYLAPLPGGGKLLRTLGVPSIKYVSAGWLCQAQLTAALLAEMGHTGDTTIFEGDYGFWRFSGSNQWQPELVTKGLGEKWNILSTRYKCYPCCGGLQTALDCFLAIITENDLKAEEVESVEAYLEGFMDEPMFRGSEIRTQADMQFNIAYLFSVAAQRIPLGPAWQDLALIRNPKIVNFMDKVHFQTHPRYVETIQKDPTSTLSSVHIKARNRMFSEERTHHRGSPATAATRMTNEELAEKFMRNASLILPWHKIDRAIESIMRLETLDEVSEMTRWIAI